MRRVKLSFRFVPEIIRYMGLQGKPNGYFSKLGRQVCIFTCQQAKRRGIFVLSPLWYRQAGPGKRKGEGMNSASLLEDLQAPVPIGVSWPGQSLEDDERQLYRLQSRLTIKQR